MRSTALILPFAAAFALAGCSSSGDHAETPSAKPAARHAKSAPAPTIGGAVVDPAGTIAANVAKAPNLTTLVSLLRAAGVDQTLTGPGPYTLFAPTNDAFSRLQPGTVDTLLKPENKASLVKLLTYVVVPGRVTIADLKQQVAAGGGSARLATVEGDALTVTLTGEILTLTDTNGNHSYVTTGDVPQANGLVQVVNGVLIPDLA